jgi:hypothetical protein
MAQEAPAGNVVSPFPHKEDSCVESGFAIDGRGESESIEFRASGRLGALDSAPRSVHKRPDERNRPRNAKG